MEHGEDDAGPRSLLGMGFTHVPDSARPTYSPTLMTSLSLNSNSICQISGVPAMIVVLSCNTALWIIYLRERSWVHVDRSRSELLSVGKDAFHEADWYLDWEELPFAPDPASD